VEHRVSRAVAAGLVAALVMALGAATAAWGEASTASRGLEVAPGVYLASASEGASQGSHRQSSSLSTSTPAPRVVGGRPTTIGKWPWQVSLSYRLAKRHDAYGSHSCGGTLVAPTIVVTAAHCVTLGGDTFQPASDFRVFTGRTKLRSHTGQRINLANYYWFTDQNGKPLWNPKTVEWDVVFLQLASPSNQQPIKIAGPDESGIWIPGRRAIVTGYGTTSEGQKGHSNVLRTARISMISDSKCDSVYGPALFPSVMVCAGDLAGGVDVCFGDSGGPLVVPVAGGAYRLVGDTSWSVGCGMPGIPGVYGRLASDPIRTALQQGIEAVAGVDVYGSGAAPWNGFSFGNRSRNRVRGTAGLTVRVPGRGKVRLYRTKRVRPAKTYPAAAGPTKLTVRARGEAERSLDRAGLARVRAKISYTPLGGERRTKITRVRLLKR
jgi:hypothetical protein